MYTIDPRCHEKVTLAIALFKRVRKDSGNSVSVAWARDFAMKNSGIEFFSHAFDNFMSAAIRELVNEE